MQDLYTFTNMLSAAAPGAFVITLNIAAPYTSAFVPDFVTLNHIVGHIPDSFSSAEQVANAYMPVINLLKDIRICHTHNTIELYKACTEHGFLVMNQNGNLGLAFYEVGANAPAAAEKVITIVNKLKTFIPLDVICSLFEILLDKFSTANLN